MVMLINQRAFRLSPVIIRDGLDDIWRSKNVAQLLGSCLCLRALRSGVLIPRNYFGFLDETIPGACRTV